MGTYEQVRKGTQVEAKKPVVVGRKTAVSAPKGGETSAEEIQRTYGNRAAQRIIQAKLKLGPAGDSYEQEADKVAQQVVSNIHQPQPVQRQEGEEEELQAKPLAEGIQRIQRQEDEDELMAKRVDSAVQREGEEDELMAKANHGMEGGDVDETVAQTIDSARGGGQALAEGVRSSMEQGFGADFSGVRIHTGGQAEALNRSLNARAFTTGSNIFFGQGQYNPTSKAGQELLAHELTHTVQQGAAGVVRGKRPWVQRDETTSTDSNSTQETKGWLGEHTLGEWGDKAFGEESEKKDQQEKDEDKLKIKLIEIEIPEQSTQIGGGELKGQGNLSLDAFAKSGAEVKITFEKGGQEFTTGDVQSTGQVKGQQIDYSGKASSKIALKETLFSSEGEMKGDYSLSEGKYNLGAKGKLSAMRGVSGELQGGLKANLGHDTETEGKLKGTGAIKGEMGGEFMGKLSDSEWGLGGKLGAFAGLEANIEPEVSIKVGGTNVFAGKGKGGFTIGLGGELGGVASWANGSFRFAGKAKMSLGLGLNFEYDVTINPYGMTKLAYMWGLLGWMGQKGWAATKWTGNALWNTGKWALGY